MDHPGVQAAGDDGGRQQTTCGENIAANATAKGEINRDGQDGENISQKQQDALLFACRAIC